MSVDLVLLLLACSTARALRCVAQSADIVLPNECLATDPNEPIDNETLILMLNRTWPDSLSVSGFIATLECAFDGKLPEIATPFAYEQAPRFTLGSAIASNRLPSQQIVLARAATLERLQTSTAAQQQQWQVGIVPLLFVSAPLPAQLEWRALERTCAAYRARHRRKHDTLCTMASSGRPSAAFLTTASHVDCDWALGYYGINETHTLPLELVRFFFHLPRALKTDLLVAVAGLAHAYTTVLFMDEDIVMQFNSTQWRAELQCAFGHIPVVWRPTFRPYSNPIWPWMNAECFDDNVRALAVGNFSFLEPQVFFVRADFFVHYIDQYVVPVFAKNPRIHSEWTLMAAMCFLAQRAFPSAVPCALSRALTAVHADLRTLKKTAKYNSDGLLLATLAIRRFPDSTFLLQPFDVVTMQHECAPARLVAAGRFDQWQPPKHTEKRVRQMVAQRIGQWTGLKKQLCTQPKKA